MKKICINPRAMGNDVQKCEIERQNRELLKQVTATFSVSIDIDYKQQENVVLKLSSEHDIGYGVGVFSASRPILASSMICLTAG